ncbi:MAG TPA: hypothetical protein VHC91_05770 [Trinickia sp.]|uniref:hypothetical protein n=1 Tax=Trinickia sp. TaxID=2571163 RepID=UPI002BF8F7D6|nr:hypothetical protein [Trinickia sp.]HVW49900.1 hypothetical protein [Trinickia sp.]
MYLLLSADAWEVQDERTGKTNSGVSAWVINDYRDESEGLGYKPTKFGLDPKLFEEIKKHPLPAFYDFAFITRPGAGGKASVVVSNVKFIKEHKVFTS